MKLLPFEPDGIFDIIEWKPFVPMKQWMETEVVINDGGNKGSFSTYRMPHMTRIFEEVDKLSVVAITLMSASQVGKTIIMVNVILKRMDTEPDNSIIMFPKGNQIKKLYENKVKPFIDGVQVIVDKMEDYVDDTKGTQSSYSKKIAGAILSILDANNTKSVSAKTIAFDEVADFPPSKVSEAIERLKSFNGKGELAFICSTQHPMKDGNDEINHYYNISELKLQYWANCRKCNKHFYPEPETLVYPTIAEWKQAVGIDIEHRVPNVILLSDYAPYCRDNAMFKCPHCENKITNEQRREQILAKEFKWIEVEPDEIAEDGTIITWKQSQTSKKHYKSVAFDVNTLCIEGFNMGNIAQDIVQKSFGKNKTHDLKHTWVGYFNRIYREKIKQADANDLLLLGSGLEKWKIPEDTLKIYMGVDTQKDHFWWEVKAYCYGMKSHSIAHGRAETFKDLEQIWEIGQNLITEHGEVFQIQKLGIDRRGYNQDGVKRTDEVDKWVREMVQKWRHGDENRIYATEGEPHLTGDAPFKVVTRKDESDNRVKIDTKTLKLSNIYLKTAIRTAMQNTIDMKKSDHPEEFAEMPQFFVNQTTVDADLEAHNSTRGTNSTAYTRQIGAEVYGFDRDKSGKLATTKTFINPKQTDNHYFDTSVICEGFAQKDQLYMEKKPTGEDLSSALSGLGAW